jgi:hypothetical protein
MYVDSQLGDILIWRRMREGSEGLWSGNLHHTTIVFGRSAYKSEQKQEQAFAFKAWKL